MLKYIILDTGIYDSEINYNYRSSVLVYYHQACICGGKKMRVGYGITPKSQEIKWDVTV